MRFFKVFNVNHDVLDNQFIPFELLTIINNNNNNNNNSSFD